jgi:predicted transcriptional regulator YheO
MRSVERILTANRAAPDDPRVQTAKKMHADKSLSIGVICKTLRISRATFYQYLAATCA